MEIWKPVKDFENLYEVSNLGRVRSLAHTAHNHIYNGQILKPGYSKSIHYRYVTLSNGVNRQQVFIHRLVAQAFCDPHGLDITDTYHTVINHKNGRKLDNRANNLEWCTQKENVRHSYKMGLQRCINNKKILCIETKKQYNSSYDAANVIIAQNNTQANKETIARNIRQCANGKRCTAYKYHWKFI